MKVRNDIMKQQAIEVSKKFWKALEAADAGTMRSLCDPNCYFVHIGGNCDLDREMQAFTDGVFQPTEIVLNQQDASVFGDTAIVITDCDYGLLLDGKPTTHHFAVTEVYQKQEEGLKLIQFTFTALVY
jgi:ketosteroid isomerase-like protein